jgi:hypothetical protein
MRRTSVAAQALFSEGCALSKCERKTEVNALGLVQRPHRRRHGCFDGTSEAAPESADADVLDRDVADRSWDEVGDEGLGGSDESEGEEKTEDGLNDDEGAGE